MDGRDLMHGAVEISLKGKRRTYRLGVAEIEELEATLDLSVFLIAGAIAMELPALRVAQWKHVIRLGLIGGGMNRAKADRLTDTMLEKHGVPQCLVIALRVIGASLTKVHGAPESPEGDGEAGQRTDFSKIYGAAAVMGVQNVGDLSFGQWAATAEGWAKAHGGNKPKAPSDAEFDAAMAADAANRMPA